MKSLCSSNVVTTYQRSDISEPKVLHNSNEELYNYGKERINLNYLFPRITLKMIAISAITKSICISPPRLKPRNPIAQMRMMINAR